MIKSNFTRILFLLVWLAGSGFVSGQPMRYNMEEKNWLDQHQSLRIGVVEQNPPLLSYGGGKNPQGLVADYLRALTRQLGLQLQITRYPDMTQLANALRSGEVDAVGTWPVGWNRVGPVLLSRPYLSLPVALYGVAEIPQAGLSGLRDKRLAVLRGSTWERLPQISPGVEIVSYASLEQALQATAHGEVYAYLGDAACADYLLKRGSFGDLELQQQVDLTYDMALATRFGDTALLSLLQKGLDRIAPEELQEIWQRWPGVEKPLHYDTEVPSTLIWLPLMLVWSVLLAWGVYRYITQRERRRRAKMKELIQRLQRRDRRYRDKLSSFKKKIVKYREETHQHRHRQSLLDEVLPSGAWVWEPQVAQCQWDERMYDLYQQDPESFTPTPEAILGRVLEEDRDQVALLFRPSTGECESHLSYRVAMPDGKVRWLLDFSYYNFDQAANTGQRIGLCWDITNYMVPIEAEPEAVES